MNIAAYFCNSEQFLNIPKFSCIAQKMQTNSAMFIIYEELQNQIEQM